MDTPTRTASVSPGAHGGCRAGVRLCTAAPWLFPAARTRGTRPYGWERIVAGGALFERCDDPGWWGSDATPAIKVDVLQVADPYACPVAQRFAGRVPPPGTGPWRRPPSPYHVGLRILGIREADAPAYGLAGADADLLTPGWRFFVTALRAGASLPVLAGLT